MPATTTASRPAFRAGADVFHAIGDPTRRRLLDTLGRGERAVNELARPFAMSRPAISQHLRILRTAGLVTMRRAGRERHYRLRAARLRQVYDWVAHYEKFWTTGLNRLGEYLDREAQKDRQSIHKLKK
ncbi:MAG TPA: metalloregulator ArsR/SmtB family transcription factor [Candidatus Acidoferrales bacterium]|jgi:DNA-binding transcriptional ArsR family regulator|nr:metalloregulator ArsR/SmtB family transcription factor [Candidatus Acidoferrales bacterium]